jgi:hypothetical protein
MSVFCPQIVWNFVLWHFTKIFHYIPFFVKSRVTTEGTIHEHLGTLLRSSEVYLAYNLCSLDQEMLRTVDVQSDEASILFSYISVSLNQEESPVCFVTAVKKHWCDFVVVH